MSLSNKNGTIVWAIAKGSSASAVINKADGWAMYDEIVMDLKISRDLEGSRVLRLSVGDGLIISGNALQIKLSYEQTSKLRGGKMYADVKLRINMEVLPPIPFELIVNETVTKI